MNPGRSFHKNARSLFQNKSPQDPATPRLFSVGHFVPPSPVSPFTRHNVLFTESNLLCQGIWKLLSCRVTFHSFKLWNLEKMAFCTVLRQDPGAVYYRYSLLTFMYFLKRSFQYFRCNILWVFFFFQFRRGFLSERIVRSNRVMWIYSVDISKLILESLLEIKKLRLFKTILP